MPGITVDEGQEDGYVTEDAQNPQGQKYLALDVPDFTSATGG